jgi:virginiamycin B lyase
MPRFAPLLAVFVALAAAPGLAQSVKIQSFAVPEGAHPHDVAPSPDGQVWYTAQRQGALGRLDPSSGKTEQIPLGRGSAPHGVVVGPDGQAWITDGGLNAIVAVHPKTLKVTTYPLPEAARSANLNTAAFDGDGVLWFTGQSGFYGRLDPNTGAMRTWKSPRGRGPYGIDATPAGEVWFASLAGSYIARIDRASGAVQPLDPPTKDGGPRRVWSDSKGVLWFTEWDGGRLGRHDPASGAWKEWRLPGDHPAPYAVYVDDRDKVWVSDFGANAMLRFDPATETFEAFPHDRDGAGVRQILGRPGEVWAAESGTDRLTVYRYQ